MAKSIKLSELKTDVENGMKRAELAAKYTDKNVNALKGLLKQAGLSIKKTHYAKYILVNDLEVTEESNTFTEAEVTSEVEA